MSISLTISGEIIESQYYLSNYFVTLNSDQTIYGIKNLNYVNISSLNVSEINSSNIITSNMSTVSLSTDSFNASNINVNQINASSLDISTTFTFKGETLNDLAQKQIYGSSDISSNLVNGTIEFGKSFDTPPCVIITQYSNRIVPLCITNITTTNFDWAASSSNVGKIIWSAGIKFNN